MSRIAQQAMTRHLQRARQPQLVSNSLVAVDHPHGTPLEPEPIRAVECIMVNDVIMSREVRRRLIASGPVHINFDPSQLRYRLTGPNIRERLDYAVWMADQRLLMESEVVESEPQPMTATEVAERQHAAEQEWNRGRAQRRVTNELANRALQTFSSSSIDIVAIDRQRLDLRPGAINWMPGQVPRRPGIEFVSQNGVPPDPLADDREAKAKARAALWRYLDDQQREHLFCFHHFAVKGSDSKMIYKISSEHTQGNINRDDGARFCITRDDLPVWDLMLAQKLMIEDSEPRFLELANRLDIPYAVDA